jgi:hypothetical protein
MGGLSGQAESGGGRDTAARQDRITNLPCLARRGEHRGTLPGWHGF